MLYSVQECNDGIVVKSTPPYQTRNKAAFLTLIAASAGFFWGFTVSTFGSDNDLVRVILLSGGASFMTWFFFRHALGAEQSVIEPEAEKVTWSKVWAGRQYDTETRRARPGDFALEVQKSRPEGMYGGAFTDFFVVLVFEEQEPLEIASMTSLDNTEKLVEQLQLRWQERTGLDLPCRGLLEEPNPVNKEENDPTVDWWKLLGTTLAASTLLGVLHWVDGITSLGFILTASTAGLAIGSVSELALYDGRKAMSRWVFGGGLLAIMYLFHFWRDVSTDMAFPIAFLYLIIGLNVAQIAQLAFQKWKGRVR